MTQLSAFRDDRNGATALADPSHPPSDQFDVLADLRKELEQLSATNREILGELRSHSHLEINLDAVAAPPPPAPERKSPPPAFDVVIHARENADLRRRIAELERAARSAPAGDDSWVERQREYEALLDEKSDVIRTLHMKIQQLEENVAMSMPAVDSQAVHDDVVERMRLELDEQRRQVEQDEENLMRQMRDMEVSLAKDRADLARQRAEIQRAQADFHRELEMASRDPQLHDRLMSLQRRSQENMGRKGSDPILPRPATMPAEPAKKQSGLFRRLFH